MKKKLLDTYNYLGGHLVLGTIITLTLILFISVGVSIDRTPPKEAIEKEVKTANKLTVENLFESGDDTRSPEHDEYSKNNLITSTVSGISFDVPKSWDVKTNEGPYFYYAEKSDKVAFLMVEVVYDDTDVVSFDILKNETDKGLMQKSLNSWFPNHDEIIVTPYHNKYFNGYIYSTRWSLDDMLCDGILFCFPIEETNSWGYVAFAQTDNTTYSYINAYLQILPTIKPA